MAIEPAAGDNVVSLDVAGRLGRAFKEARPPLKSGDDGGTSGGVTDDWKASVDQQLKQLHDDVRRLTGWLIAGAIAPFLAIIGLYVYTGAKSDAVETRIVGVENRMSAVQVEQARTNGKLDLLLERTKPR